MSDYETLFFLERQEAFWKGRKLSGKAGSFLVYHEASDGPFGPFWDPWPFWTLWAFWDPWPLTDFS